MIARVQDSGWRGAESLLLARRARADARRGIGQCIARDIPDPAEFARLLPLAWAEALASAWHPVAEAGGRAVDVWRVESALAAELRPYGLVEFGAGCRLTAFGIKVRRALLEADG